MSSVRVVARIRPLLKAELERDIIVHTYGSGGESDSAPTSLRIPNPKNENEHYNFSFSRVYRSETSQQELFDKEGKGPLQEPERRSNPW